MTAPDPSLAERGQVVVHALRHGLPLTDTDRGDALALMGQMHARALDAETLSAEARAQREAVEREANAMAAVLADLLDGARINDVVDDLPHDARRRVLAYRHAGMPGMLGAARPRDQFGPLPKVPPRAAVMRDRLRTFDPTTHAAPEEGPTDGT